ncbi:MAG: HNH endonuclease, partial [Acidimicrobiia bacterium]
RCTYCPRPATTADHVVPVSRGGSHALSNLVPACGPCNTARGAALGRATQKARRRPS